MSAYATLRELAIAQVPVIEAYSNVIGEMPSKLKQALESALEAPKGPVPYSNLSYELQAQYIDFYRIWRDGRGVIRHELVDEKEAISVDEEGMLSFTIGIAFLFQGGWTLQGINIQIQESNDRSATIAIGGIRGVIEIENVNDPSCYGAAAKTVIGRLIEALQTPDPSSRKNGPFGFTQESKTS